MRLVYILTISILLTLSAYAEKVNYREFNIGKAKIYAIEDKEVIFKKDVFITRDNELLDKLLPNGECKASINTFVIKTDNDTYLFDTGVGAKDNGKTLKALKSIGIKPEQISKVVISHLHKDHIGGLVASDGSMIFKNALVYVPRVDYDYWNSADGIKKTKGISELMKRVKSAYGRKLFSINAEDAFFDGIIVYDASGHTPGHTIFEFNYGVPFVFIADIIHCIDVQLASSDIGTKFDMNQREAKLRRIKVIDDLSATKKIVLSSHIKFPGVIKFTPYNLNAELGYDYYSDNRSEEK